MEIIIQNDADTASVTAAEIVKKLLNGKTDPVLGLATGSTPAKLYKELIRMHKEEGLDFSDVTSFNLDEYIGLDHNHPDSYYTYMHELLFNHINIKEQNIHIPNGMAENIPAHCNAYEKAIFNAGGIDLQILGIGSDGHIGFNEPTSSLASRTRIKTLTEETRKDNAGFFNSPNDVPYHCLTMGMGTILDSRNCLLLAFGKAKARAVADMIEGPVAAICPASALQLHQHVSILLDEEAASELKLKDYYKYIYEHKPEWQK